MTNAEFSDRVALTNNFLDFLTDLGVKKTDMYHMDDVLGMDHVAAYVSRSDVWRPELS